MDGRSDYHEECVVTDVQATERPRGGAAAGLVEDDRSSPRPIRRVVLEVLAGAAQPLDADSLRHRVMAEPDVDASAGTPLGEVIEGLIVGGLAQRRESDLRFYEITSEGRQALRTALRR